MIVDTYVSCSKALYSVKISRLKTFLKRRKRKLIKGGNVVS